MRIKKALVKHEGFFVGMARFELATSWSQTRRDDRTTLRPELGFYFNLLQSFLKQDFSVLRVQRYSLISLVQAPERKIQAFTLLLCGESEIRTRGTVTSTSV
jgi:hypothetical protein